MEIAFADGEHPAVRLHSIELLEVVLQLITEELRHLDHAVTLGCFRRSDHILLIEPLVRLIDGDGALFKVKICQGEGQQLSLTDTAPVQYLKGVEGQRLIHHSLKKAGVFLSGPEQHLLSFLRPHVARLPGWIDIQTVKSGSMVENGAKLVVNCLQVSFRQRFAMAVPQLPDFILPTDNVLCRDLREFSICKIGEDLFLDDTLLGKPGIEFQLGFNVLLVESNEALKGHVHISLFFHQELPFPFQRFSLGGKATLELLLAFTLPIGVAELNIPGAIVLIFERCHNYFSFLSVSDLVP